jgi:hypothetical protein
MSQSGAKKYQNNYRNKCDMQKICIAEMAGDI